MSYNYTMNNIKILVVDTSKLDPDCISDSDLQVKMYPIEEIPLDIICDILSFKINEKEIKTLLNVKGFYTKDQIKEEKGYKITNKDTVYFKSSYRDLEELNEYSIGEYAKNGGQLYYTCEPDAELNKKIKDIQDKESARKKKLVEKKKQKEIERARKILAAAKIEE